MRIGEASAYGLQKGNQLSDYFGSMDDLEAAKRLCIQRGVAKRAENPNTHRRGSAFVVFSWSKGAYTAPCSKRLGPSPLLVVGRVLF